MGQSTRGIYPDGNEWQVDKWYRKQRLRQRGFPSFEEAERWLIKQLDAIRETAVHGERQARTFDQAAAHYVLQHEDKVSLPTEISLLGDVMPHIGELELQQVHDGTLAPFVTERLEDGIAHKTVNLALGVVRRILNLAAASWRDEAGITWLAHAPKLTMLPLVGHQREPKPISWAQQRRLLPELPGHLARMALFVLNTGVRDNVVCSLRWEWEIKIPELGISVFEVPRENVKGRRRTRVVVCNSVAQSIVESMRGRHAEFVFVWRRERGENSRAKGKPKPYAPIARMNNTAWENARFAAALDDLHVHDLRHTAGMRMREAGIDEATISDVLWHSTKTMTRHYSVAQIVQLHQAVETLATESKQWNKTLATLRSEQEESRREKSPPESPSPKPAQPTDARQDASPPEVPTQRKTA